MDIQEVEIEQFDRYFRKEMTAEEQQQFEEKLQGDALLSKKYDTYLSLINAIHLVGREDLKKRIAKNGEVKYFSNQWGKKWTIAYAAIFLFFIGLFFVFERGLHERIFPNVSEQSYEEVETVEKPSKTLAKKKAIKQTTQEELVEMENTDTTIDAEVELYENEIDDMMVSPETDIAMENSEDDIQEDKAVRPSSADSRMSNEQAGIPRTSEIVSASILADTSFLAVTIDNIEGEISLLSETSIVRILFSQSPLNSKVYQYWTLGKERQIEVFGLPYPYDYKAFIYKDEILLIGKLGVYRFTKTRSYLPLNIVNDKELKKKLEDIYGD